MKKIIIASAICAALSMGSAFAFNSSNMYVNANGGVFIPGSSMGSILDVGYNVGAALGYRFNQNLRTDLSLGYTYNKFDILGYDLGSWQQYLVMINGYYDFANSSNFVPYIGMGVGVNHMIGTVSYQDYSAKGTLNKFAAQGILGVDYKLNAQVDLGMNYHIILTRDTDANIYSNMLNFSFTYKF